MDDFSEQPVFDNFHNVIGSIRREEGPFGRWVGRSHINGYRDRVIAFTDKYAVLDWIRDTTRPYVNVTRCGLCTDGDVDLRRNHACEVEDFYLNA